MGYEMRDSGCEIVKEERFSGAHLASRIPNPAFVSPMGK